jgi:hypothetical protein
VNSPSSKQLVYRYNGDATTDEAELDMHAEISIPEKGSFIERQGRRWKVVHIVVEQLATAVPVYRVFLIDKF